jgi:hypothetical protein
MASFGLFRLQSNYSLNNPNSRNVIVISAKVDSLSIQPTINHYANHVNMSNSFDKLKRSVHKDRFPTVRHYRFSRKISLVT